MNWEWWVPLAALAVGVCSGGVIGYVWGYRDRSRQWR